MATRRAVLAGALALAGCAPSDTEVFVTLSQTELDAALAQALAQSPAVNFPRRILFRDLRFRHVGGLGIDGVASRFDPTSGTFSPSEVTFSGSVPPGWWRVEEGALRVRLASVDTASPVPGGGPTDGRQAELLRDELGTAVGEVLARMAFATGVEPEGRWRIGSAGSEDGALRFELRRR